MGSEKKVFTLAEVSEHNSSKDCWLVISGRYELYTHAYIQWSKTNVRVIFRMFLGAFGMSLGFVFVGYRLGLQCDQVLEDHPGGDEVLLSATGKDATDDFEDVGHSSTARAMMDEMYVGDIDTGTIPAKKKYMPPQQPHYNQDKTPEFIIKVLPFLVPLLILGLAVGIRFYTKKSE